MKKSCVTGLGWRTPVIRCAFSGAIASLADLKGLRQPIFSQLLEPWDGALYRGTALQAAEKVASRDVLKGHGFSRAVQVLSFRHPERTLVREGSAFPTFSAACSVVP